jgi:hypothetical protein
MQESVELLAFEVIHCHLHCCYEYIPEFIEWFFLLPPSGLGSCCCVQVVWKDMSSEIMKMTGLIIKGANVIEMELSTLC